jgi:hypothetical protein
MKILVSGASWTAGTNLSKSPDDIDPFNWTKQLATELSCEVTNLAESGTSADFVVRTLISGLESFSYDVAIGAFPALHNRREIILRDESYPEMKYEYVSLSGVPSKPMTYGPGKFLSSRKQSVIDEWDGYVMNNYEDFNNYLKNIILLGQYLEIKNIKNILIFDIDPPQFIMNSDCSIATNKTLVRLQELAKRYISYDDILMKYISHDPIFMDRTEHPSSMGHILLGKIMAEKVRLL